MKKAKLTPKQAAFARAYVETGNASEAYRRTYNVREKTKPESVWVKASELLANGKIKVRGAELQETATKRTQLTVERLTLELDNAINHALKHPKGASAAVSAIMGKAKWHGLLVVKQDHTSSDGSMSSRPTLIRIVAADDGCDDTAAAENGADIQ